MTGYVVFAVACLITALALRIGPRWRQVRAYRMPDQPPSSSSRTALAEVPAAWAAGLEPYDLSADGFSCLGLFGWPVDGPFRGGNQLWLDATRSIVGVVVLKNTGGPPRCWPAFASYLGAEDQLRGVIVTAVPRRVLGLQRPGSWVQCLPGASQQLLLSVHRAQRRATLEHRFVEFSGMADLGAVQDRLATVTQTWLLESGLLTPTGPGRARLSRRAAANDAVRALPPVRARAWYLHRKATRLLQRWPPDRNDLGEDNVIFAE